MNCWYWRIAGERDAMSGREVEAISGIQMARVDEREEAIKIAQATRESVLSTSSPISSAEEMRKAAVTRVTANGEIVSAPKAVGTSGMRSLKSATSKNSPVLAPCTGE